MKMKKRRAFIQFCPISCAGGLDSQVVDEYNKREKEIQDMEKELDDKTNALTTYRQNIAEVRPTTQDSQTSSSCKQIKRVPKHADVFPRRKSAGWILWSSWWIRSMSASVISFVRCSALERWNCTLRMRWGHILLICSTGWPSLAVKLPYTFIAPFFHTQHTLGDMDWLFCSVSAQLSIKGPTY